MKYSTIIGILLLLIGFVASFVAKYSFNDLITDPEFAVGLSFGGGAGLIFGGFLGWLYKRTKPKKDKTTVEPTSNPENVNTGSEGSQTS